MTMHQINDRALVSLLTEEQSPTFPVAHPNVWSLGTCGKVYYENDRSGKRRLELSIPEAWLVLDDFALPEREGLSVLRCAVAF
jgi:hypothetical protein